MRPQQIFSIVAVVGALAVGAAVGSAQQPAGTNQATTQNMMDLQRTMGNMMSMQRNMMSMTNQSSTQLNQLMAKVEAAKGDAQVAAMVDLLKAIVADRQQFHQQQMQMQGQMMNGMNMMSHMMGGGMMNGGMMDGRNGRP
jgi:hypothetical protein